MSLFPFSTTCWAKEKADGIDFFDQVDPILNSYCYQCHDEDVQKGDVQLDFLDPDMINGPDGEAWHAVLDVINSGDMPPKKKKQPKDDERRLLVDWITDNLKLAKEKKKGEFKGGMRRLTRQQYSKSINDLLGLDIDVSELLPPDTVSKMGFSNDSGMQHSSGLLLESYQTIARDLVTKAIGPIEKPPVYHYQINFGKKISKKKNAEKPAFQEVVLSGHDFQPKLLNEQGVPYEKDDEMKGFGGKVEEILSDIAVGLRGSDKKRFAVEEDGMLLFGANPQPNEAPQSWRPPNPNIKLLIRNGFPQEGPFRYTVKASRVEPEQKTPRYQLHQILGKTPNESQKWLSSFTTPKLKKINEGWEANANTMILSAKEFILGKAELKGDHISAKEKSDFKAVFDIKSSGYYQIDMVRGHISDKKVKVKTHIELLSPVSIYEKRVSFQVSMDAKNDKNSSPSNGLVAETVMVGYADNGPMTLKFSKSLPEIYKLVLTPLSAKEAAPIKKQREEALALLAKDPYKNTPAVVRGFMGTRLDDGESFDYFDVTHDLHHKDGVVEVEFRDHMENFTLPVTHEEGGNEMSGTMVLGMYNHHLAPKSDNVGPLMKVHSMSFEVPYYESWPPKSHQHIFGKKVVANSTTYTKTVLRNFAIKAFRQDFDEALLQHYYDFWLSIRSDYDRYEDSVAEVLVAMVSSPQFLFMTEPQNHGESGIDEFQLASRMSFYLWNRGPDVELLKLAERGQLFRNMDLQIERMLKDKRSEAFVHTFGEEWLHLSKLDAIELIPDFKLKVDSNIKELLKQETLAFLTHALKENLSISNFIDSDHVMLNEHLASFYNIDGVKGHDMRPIQVDRKKNRGGLLSQAAFLIGHSDGKDGHPIKRAMWLMERFMATEPPPPPPNVPGIDDEDPTFKNLTMKQKLEAHRNKPACFDCHAKIDPWGVAFEQYNALGQFNPKADAKTTLPDGEDIMGIQSLKRYLQKEKMETVAKSVVEHLLA